MNWWHWSTDNLDGATNMAVDEATMIHADPGQVILRTYTWNPPCLSLGCFQKVSDANRVELNNHGFDLVRRATGGRAVLHDKELTYSIVIRNPHPMLSKTILESYYILCEGIVDMLKSLGLQAEIKRSDDRSMSTPSCFTAPTFGDIEVNGKKIVGSAQMRTEQGLLQHGSIINSLDRLAIFSILTDNKSKAEKLAGLSRKKMTSIEEELKTPKEINILSNGLLNSFKKTLRITLKDYEPTDEFWHTVNELKDKKYGSVGWTEKR